MQEDKVLDPFRGDNEDSLLRRISLSRDSLLGWIDHRVVSGSKRGSTQCRRSSTVGSGSKNSLPQVGKYSKRRRAVWTVTYTFYISEMSRLGRGTRMLEQLILKVNHIMSYLDILSSTHSKFDYPRFFDCFLLDVFVLCPSRTYHHQLSPYPSTSTRSQTHMQ